MAAFARKARITLVALGATILSGLIVPAIAHADPPRGRWDNGRWGHNRPAPPRWGHDHDNRWRDNRHDNHWRDRHDHNRNHNDWRHNHH